MAQSKTAKIMAILALLGIIISIIGTGILFFIGSFNNKTQNQVITKEELEKLVNKNKVSFSNSGVIIK